MTGVVFTETLRRNWKAALYWGIGVALLGVYIIVAIPSVDVLQQYAGLISNMPPVLLAALGITDTAQMVTPEGFMSIGFFGYVMLVLAAYGVIAGLNVTANEEDRGILDMVLSLPIPRWRVLLERYFGYTVLIILMLVLTGGLMWLSTMANAGMTFDTGKMFQGVLNLLPGTLTVLAFTVFAGGLLRSRGTAAAVAAGFVVLSYFIDFIGNAASGTAAANLRVVSFFSYYDGGHVMTTGLQWGNILVLVAAAVALVAAGTWFFERRDIGL
ncbi:MAG: ABC transporter permease subunit [Chloroflexota bacterium]